MIICYAPDTRINFSNVRSDKMIKRRRQMTVKLLKRGNERQDWRPGMKRIRIR